MAAEASPVEALFDKLNQCIKNQQHKKALKACDEILALVPGDEDALRCKVAAHMSLSDFEAALALINKPALSTLALGLEKGYCLYRLGKLDEALATTQAALADASLDPSRVPALLQLEAQLQYRQGATRDCIHTYDRLFKQHKVESLELKTNVLAAYVAAGLASEIPDLMAAMKVSPKDSFEVGFNKACGLVEAGQLVPAEGELRMAIKLGRETLFEEELGDEEVEDELAPLSCQLAYVLGRLGRAQEAAELYETLIRGKLQLSDEAVKALAHNNVVADAPHRLEAGPQNRKYINSCTRRLEALLERPPGAAAPAPAGEGEGGGVGGAALLASLAGSVPKGGLPRFVPALESRMGAAQKRALLLNLGLLYLVGGRADAARALASILSAAGQPGALDPQVTLLTATAMLSEGKSVDADRTLEAFCAAAAGQGAAAVGPTLLRAQVALNNGNVPAAQALLAGIAAQSVALSGAVIATRVALYEQLSDSAGAEALLESALAHWRSRAGDAGAASALGWCLSTAVGLKLRLGKLDEATKAFKQLQASGVAATAAGAGVLARLARALAVAEPAAAPVLVKASAPEPPAADVRSLELDALEEGAARGASGGATAAGARRGPDLAGGELAAAAKAGGKGGKRAGDAMDVDKQPKAKKSKSKRKPRYPKGYNPELPNGGLPAPDAERWLPKWERSDYKKKRDRRRREKDALKGSQGAGKVDENLDRSKAAAPSAPAEKQSAKPQLPARKGKGKK